MGTGEPHASRAPAPTRTALWLAAYVVASALGRIITVQPHSVGVVWPAAGIGLVWLASASTTRQLVVDTVLLSLTTMVVLVLTDGGASRAALSLLSVIQILVALWLIRRWVPGIWGTGGREVISRLSQFGAILAAVAIGALSMALLRTVLGVLLVPGEGWDLGIGRWGRNSAAMATIGVFGLVLGGWLAQHRDAGTSVLARPSRGDVLHAAGVLATTAGIFYFGFYLQPDIPSTFMLTLTVVWCAIRFNLVVTAGLSVLTGAMTVLMTILGYGPISSVGDPETRALLAQVFVVVLVVIGLTIALTRRQFFDTIGRLEQSEAALALRASELDLVMSHLEDGVAIVEEGGRIVHTNTAMRTAFGTRPEQPIDLVGEPEGQAFHRDGRPLEESESPLVRALAGEVIDAEEYHHVDGDGVARWLEVSAFPIPHAADAPPRAMVVIRDITAATNHRESLVSFAGTVAHDLNNPLSVIDGWAEALEEDFALSQSTEAARATPMVQHIRASVAQARAFISDLLAHTVARDQALECEQISLQNMVKHITGSRDRPRNGAEIVAGQLVDVWADPVLVRQVLDNLIGNAFKYVAPGTPPRILVEAEPLGNGWACVRVRDNGIGVAPAQRERIFDSFHRASTNGYQGTGLGLAICKRIIERHGGTIRVTDNPDGVGSCFEFTLPTDAEALRRATTG